MASEPGSNIHVACPLRKSLQPGVEAAKLVSLAIRDYAESRLQKRKENAIMEQHFAVHLREMVFNIYTQRRDNTNLGGYMDSRVKAL